MRSTPGGTTTQSARLQDKLNITGLRAGASPAGVVNFRLYQDNDKKELGCTVQIGSDLGRPIVAGVASTDEGVAVAGQGIYYWVAEYTGDQYNEPFFTPCGREVTTINDQQITN